MHIHQDAHQLGDRDRRMRVVELDRDLSGSVGDIAVMLACAAARGPAATRRRRNTPAAAAVPARPASRREGYSTLEIVSARACCGQRADMVAVVDFE